MQPINGAQTYAIAHFFLFLLVAPRGGVTGRPAFRPPYANFRLSAGWQQIKTAEKLFISTRRTEGHAHTALEKTKKNFTRYSKYLCEFNIANPRAVIQVYLLLGKVWMCNSITLYQENKLQGHQHEDSRKPLHDCCDHGCAVYLYITYKLQSLMHIRILNNRIY
jgi:hypothetical protein